MTVFDYIVIGIICLSLLFGLWRGVVSEVIALIAWISGILAAVEYGAQAGQMIFSGIADPAIQALAGCIVMFIGVLLAMSLVRLAVRSMVKALGLSVSDRLLGMCFGLVRGLLVTMVLVGLGGMTSAPKQIWWTEAMFAQPMETAVLVAKQWLPDDLAKRIRFS
jgi:membrane protein required for colicin V production